MQCLDSWKEESRDSASEKAQKAKKRKNAADCTSGVNELRKHDEGGNAIELVRFTGGVLAGSGALGLGSCAQNRIKGAHIGYCCFVDNSVCSISHF